MSAYEELIERCIDLFRELDSSAPNDEFTHRAYAKTLLTSIRRTLETVTPEMMEATWAVEQWGPTVTRLRLNYLAMLHASPLEPPK